MRRRRRSRRRQEGRFIQRIDRLHPDKATEPIKYTSHGLV
jgi:hypothetical protein